MKLYELTDERLKLLEMLEDEDVSEEAIMETLELNFLDIKDKFDGYGKILRQMQADREMLKAEKMRLAAKEKAVDNGIERLRNYMLNAMLLMDETKVKTELFTVSVTTRVKPVVTIEPRLLPEQFKKVEYKADNKEIEEYLKAGNEVDWAHLEQVKGLTVR